MANEKMIMGVPPDEDPKSKKKGGGITKIIIVLSVVFAGGFFYLKNNSDTVKEKGQSQKIVQQAPQKTLPAKTQEVEVTSPSSVATSQQPDNLNINFKNNEQVQTQEQAPPTHSVVVVQEDPNKSEVLSVTMRNEDNAVDQPMDAPMVENNERVALTVKNIPDESEPTTETLTNQIGKEVSVKESISQNKFQEKNVISQISKNPTNPKNPTIWTVKTGEYLWMISKDTKTFGDPQKWKAIYEANKDQIVDANLIYPGQKLIIPN